MLSEVYMSEEKKKRKKKIHPPTPRPACFDPYNAPGNFSKIPEWLELSPEVSLLARSIYGRLVQHWGQVTKERPVQKAFPSIDTLSVELTISRDKVKRGILELETHKLLFVKRRATCNNEYSFPIHDWQKRTLSPEQVRALVRQRKDARTSEVRAQVPPAYGTGAPWLTGTGAPYQETHLEETQEETPSTSTEEEPTDRSPEEEVAPVLQEAEADRLTDNSNSAQKKKAKAEPSLPLVAHFAALSKPPHQKPDRLTEESSESSPEGTDAPGSSKVIDAPGGLAQTPPDLQNDPQDEPGQLQAVWKSLWSTSEPTPAECARLIDLCGGFTNAERVLRYWLIKDWMPLTRRLRGDSVTHLNMGALIGIKHLREGLLAESAVAAQRAAEEAEEERLEAEAEAHRKANPPPPPPLRPLPRFCIDAPQVHLGSQDRTVRAAADEVLKHWSNHGVWDPPAGPSEELSFGLGTIYALTEKFGAEKLTLMINYLVEHWDACQEKNLKAVYLPAPKPTLWALWSFQKTLAAAVGVAHLKLVV